MKSREQSPWSLPIRNARGSDGSARILPAQGLAQHWAGWARIILMSASLNFLHLPLLHALPWHTPTPRLATPRRPQIIVKLMSQYIAVGSLSWPFFLSLSKDRNRLSDDDSSSSHRLKPFMRLGFINFYLGNNRWRKLHNDFQGCSFCHFSRCKMKTGTPYSYPRWKPYKLTLYFFFSDRGS